MLHDLKQGDTWMLLPRSRRASQGMPPGWPEDCRRFQRRPSEGVHATCCHPQRVPWVVGVPLLW